MALVIMMHCRYLPTMGDRDFKCWDNESLSVCTRGKKDEEMYLLLSNAKKIKKKHNDFCQLHYMFYSSHLI